MRRDPLRLNPAIMIVVLAILVYASRDTLLGRLAPDSVQTASVAPLALLTDTQPETQPHDTAAKQPTDLLPAYSAEPIRGQVSRNSSIYLELRELGVPPEDIQGAVAASRSKHNLKYVRPGQEFDLWNTSGVMDSLYFYVSDDRFLRVWRDKQTFVAALDTVAYETVYRVTTGTIETSLYESLVAQQAPIELADYMAEILGWSVDFFSDIRKGDTYAALYRERVYPNGRSYMDELLSTRLINAGQEYHAVLFTPGGENSGYYDIEGNSMQKSLLRSPVKYSRVTSSFSSRRYHPVTKRVQPHYGTDYGAPRGTPIFTTGDGIVLEATRTKGNGNYVKIKHNNTYTTYYLHMNGFAKGVRKGTRVKQGQLIGYVGDTGYARGTHVCYRVKRGGSWVNPRRLKLPAKKPVPTSDMERFAVVRGSYLQRMSEVLAGGAGNRTVAVEQPNRRSTPRLISGTF